MNIGVRVGIVALLLCSPSAVRVAAAQVIPSGTVRSGTLSFDGRATVGAFTGTTTTVTGALQGGALDSVRGWVAFPVQSLVTGNAHRDRDMGKSLESRTYPSVRFELTGVTPLAMAGDSMHVNLRGQFTIHGVTHDAAMPATVILDAGTVRVRAETKLNLTDYAIGGLTRMFGTLRMDEHIDVHVDLVFGPT